MIFRRILMAMAAVGAFAAGASVMVFALGFALYALAEPRFGRAGAAATVAAVTGGLILVGALGLSMGARKPSAKSAAVSGKFVDRVVAFVRQKPVLTVVAAIGAGFLAVRDPKYLGELLKAFVDDGSAKRK